MSDEIPNMVLPKVSSSTNSAKAVGAAIARKVNEDEKGTPLTSKARAKPSPAPSGWGSGDLPTGRTAPISDSRSVRMTLAELDEMVNGHEEEQIEESGWSPGSFLKKATPQIRRSGHGLAAAALSKMKKRL